MFIAAEQTERGWEISRNGILDDAEVSTVYASKQACVTAIADEQYGESAIDRTQRQESDLSDAAYRNDLMGAGDGPDW